MKNTAALLLLLCLSACSVSSDRDPLLDRHGDTLTVTIDGQPTKRGTEARVTDRGNAAETWHWRATSSGAMCFSFTMNDPRLGEFRQADVVITELDPKKRAHEQRHFQLSPAPTPETLRPGVAYCPNDLFLTPRVRFKRLPAGAYLVRFQVNGVSNWDGQSIFLSVP